MSQPQSPVQSRSATEDYKSPHNSTTSKNSKHRSQDDPDDKHSSRHRRERDREREKERESDVRRSSRSRDDRQRDRDRRRRSRSRGAEEHHRSERDDRDRDRDRDRRREREREDRDRDRERDREDRESRRRRKREDDEPASEDTHHFQKRHRDDHSSERMDVDSKDHGEVHSRTNGHHRETTEDTDVIASKAESLHSGIGTTSAPNDDVVSASSSTKRSGAEGRDRGVSDRGTPRGHERDRERDRRSYSDRRDYDDRRRSGRDYDYRGDYDRDRRDYGNRRYEDDRPRRRRPSPSYDTHPSDVPPPDEDSEARSIFVSQLAARLTSRDLGHFFEDKLGEGCVRDTRLVTDRISRRSKGIAYVELASIDLVPKAIALTGTIVMGLPIMIQLTEAERNRQQANSDLMNLSSGLSPGMPDEASASAARLYVGSLHFNLSESDIKQVFEPFGELDFVDLHKDPQTGRSKGYAFVQYKRAEDAKMALEQMEGFELAGRQLRVNTVHEKGSTRTAQDSLDEAGGGNLNNVSRQALMQKLARTEIATPRPPPIMRMTNIPTTMPSKCLLLRNMFSPEEETERDWDKELAADVKEECEGKYGSVEALKVEIESQGEIYIKFDSVDSATKALQGLHGRWFGGKQVSANYVSDVIMQAHLG